MTERDRRKGGENLPRPRRRFGQNFLVDPCYAARIVELADLEIGDIAVEIGPGRGAITRLLAGKGCTVYALEIDRDLFRRLRAEFEGRKNVHIMSGDALCFDFPCLLPEGRRMKVIANLPYNVATPILFRLLDFRDVIDRMVLMFQKEVADRITAEPGSRNFGALSIFPRLYADVRVALKLPPGAFHPVPKVHSSVLVFEMLKHPRFTVKDDALLKKLVRTAFSQRRKKISNALKSIFKDEDLLKTILCRAGIDQSARPETLSLEDFCRLSNEVSRLPR